MVLNNNILVSKDRNIPIKRSADSETIKSSEKNFLQTPSTKYDENHLRPLRLSITIPRKVFILEQKEAGGTVVECHTF